MPSTIPRVLQPPFSLTQLLNEQHGETNQALVTLADGVAENIVVVDIGSVTEGSIVWFSAGAGTQPDAPDIQLDASIVTTADQADPLSWFGGALARPEISELTGGRTFLPICFSGVAIVNTDLTNFSLTLRITSTGGSTLMVANSAGMQGFILRA